MIARVYSIWDLLFNIFLLVLMFVIIVVVFYILAKLGKS